MLLRFARQSLGLVIVFLDWITRPKPIQRSDSQQKAAQKATKGLALYQLNACPFCVRTRRSMHRLNIDIETRDIRKKETYRNQLLKGGGQIQVPCLRIEEKGNVRWIYESKDIIQILEERFDEPLQIAA